MTIIGLGIDATEIPRIAETMGNYGDRFLHRVFTAGEIAYCQSKRHAAQHFAARFAVKEAAMKALGTGHSRGVLWRDVEVVRHGGPPQLRFHGGAARRFEALGGRSSVVTITHTDTLALAQVILMGG
ncbi:MAG: holo-[acyl-carrier-protein] synthase [Acidobacteria bacterium]|nr:MAG: holo-[acyl-carrier-protein] synthase [Acidobacteriota bacterium]